jgi:ABC-type dipeptide/oligopeptide/nickel transport system permease component
MSTAMSATRRLLLTLPLLLGLTLVTFMLLHLSGEDPAVMVAGPTADAATIREVRHELHLDEPLWAQYVEYIQGLSRGDLGFSWLNQQPVGTVIRQRLPVTLELITIALGLSTLVGLAIAFVSVELGRSPGEVGLKLATLTGISMPIFWLGLLLIYVFYFLLRIAPL